MDEFKVKEYDTDPKSFKAMLLWTILWNSRLNLNNYKYKHSAVCKLGKIDKRLYRMKLTRSALSDYWDLDFRLMAHKNDKMRSTITFSILGNDGVEINKHSFELHDNDSWLSIPLFYKKQYFQYTPDKHSKRLKIICRITFVCKSTFPKDSSIDQKHFKQISDDFGKLVNNETHSDVILKANDTVFHAHKVILSARSLVFAAMFNHDSKDQKKVIFEISDIEPDIIRSMLDFIYMGRVRSIGTKAQQLLKVADRYDLEGLKDICVEEICKTLTLENAIHVLVLAERHNCDQMKNTTLDFIKARLIQMNLMPNEFYVIQDSNPELAADILRLYVTSKYFENYFT